MLGMISSHWQKPHSSTERDLRLLDILARQAADLIERRKADEALRQSERRLHEIIEALPAAVYTTDSCCTSPSSTRPPWNSQGVSPSQAPIRGA